LRLSPTTFSLRILSRAAGAFNPVKSYLIFSLLGEDCAKCRPRGRLMMVLDSQTQTRLVSRQLLLAAQSAGHMNRIDKHAALWAVSATQACETFCVLFGTNDAQHAIKIQFEDCSHHRIAELSFWMQHGNCPFVHRVFDIVEQAKFGTLAMAAGMSPKSPSLGWPVIN
jgi:hypothetical protein